MALWIGMTASSCGADGEVPPTPTLRPTGQVSTPVTGGVSGSGVISTFPGSWNSVEGAVPAPTGDLSYPDPEEYSGRFVLPVDDWTSVLDHFGDERRGGLIHGGIDIGFEGRPSSPILAACDGEVASVSVSDSLGLHLVLDCGDGWTVVAGFLATVEPETGDTVERGDIIGRSGPDGSHVHFEMRYRDVPLDPQRLLDFPDVPRPPETPTPIPPTPGPAVTRAPEATPEPGATFTPEPAPEETPTPTLTPTVTPTPTITPTPTRTPTPSPTPVPRPTATPTLPISRR